MSIKDLQYNVTEYLKGGQGNPETSRRIVNAAKNVAVHMLDMATPRLPEKKAPTDKTIRMSELGEPCLRKLMYKWYLPEYGLPPFADPAHPYLPVKFTYGDYVEELTLFLAEEAGHSVSHRQHKVELHVPGTDWYAKGSMDAVIDGTVVDVKSSADVSFNKYKREGLTDATDSFGYIFQLDGYAAAMGTLDRAFLFVNKHDGEILTIDRSSEPLTLVNEKIAIVGEVAETFITSNKLEPRFPTKVTKYGHQLGTVCSYCAFKYKCYAGDIKGVIVSSRPQYFVESTITMEGHGYFKDKTQIRKPSGWVGKVVITKTTETEVEV